ncbi:MAG TPA: hypothetical protein VNJ04_03985 [Gemmatimonadaceae bacterium]|nr:hypothetical protein [Gemmatimonadaceae bacterium]
MGQFHPADHTRGDANTIGGYMAVHARPAAFEGSDSASYSVEIVTDTTGEAARPFGAYLLFVRWRAADPVATGHLETDFLEFAQTEEAARHAVGALSLNAVKALLDGLIRARTEASAKPWWEVMRTEGEPLS